MFFFNFPYPKKPVYMGKRHKKRAACERLRRSGPDRIFFRDRKEPLGSGLWRLADLSLDKENSLASGRPFPRSRKPSGVRRTFPRPRKLSGARLDRKRVV